MLHNCPLKYIYIENFILGAELGMRHIFDDASRVAVSCCFLDGSPRCFFKVFPSVIAVSHQVSFFSNKNETSHYKNISPPSAVILYGPLLVVKFTPAHPAVILNPTKWYNTFSETILYLKDRRRDFLSILNWS